MAPVKDRVRKHRQNQTEEQKAVAREKDKLRKKAARKKMSASQRKAESVKSARRVTKQRNLKKCVQSNPASPTKVYKSPQALGKAVAKVRRSLPKSPTKEKAVVATIARQHGILVKKQIPRGPNVLPETSRNLITSYYERDAISYQAPGRKDSIIARVGQNKEKRQKKYLYMTLSEVYETFKTEYPEVKVGLSTFASLRPQHVLLSSQTPANVCVCSYHANVDFLLSGINMCVQSFPEKCNKLVETLVCDSQNKQCMMGICQQCGNLKKYEEAVQEMDKDLLEQNAKWYRWITDSSGHAVKELQEGTVADALYDLEKKLPTFLSHCFLKEKQSTYFEYAKKHLVNEAVCVLQVDFSENFSICQQDEIQSAHWNSDQITIYTAVAYTSEGVISYAIISDFMQHDKLAVHAFNQRIFGDLKSKLSNLKEVHIFSDGASQHFKQRYTLANITFGREDCDLLLNWHFFCTSHGKGAVDGVGGMLKHHVWQKVKSRRAFVTDCASFIKCAQSVTSKVNLIYVPAEEILSHSAKLEERWESIRAIPNTHQIHCVRTVDKYKVTSGMLSEEDGESFCFRMVEEEEAQQERVIIQDGNSTSAIVSVSFGQWVNVKFESERGIGHQFVGQVIGETHEGNVSVKFVKKIGNKLYVWPEKDDICDVDISQIVCILKEPSTDIRERLLFPE